MQLEAGGEAGNDTRVVRHVVRVARRSEARRSLMDWQPVGTSAAAAAFMVPHQRKSAPLTISDSNYRRT